MSRKSEFSLLGRISIGQYIPTGSLVHRLDPRVKLLLGICFIGASVACTSLSAHLLLLVVVMGAFLLSGVKLRFAFAALKPMIPFLFLLALIQVFAVPQFRTDASVLWQRSIFTVTDRSLFFGFLLVARFIVIVLGIGLLSFSTSMIEFIHGIEHLLRPFQRLRLPAHEISLVIHISLRFLPILLREAEKLMKAQASRGADFGRGRYNFFQRMKRMLPLFIPMFILSLRNAQNLIEAMQSRCYMGGKDRTHLIRLRSELKDYIALGFGFWVVAAAFALWFVRFDQTLFNWVKTLV